MKKEETLEQKEKRHLKEKNELIRREKEFAKKKPKGYLWFLFLVLSLVYITDEVASQISIQNQSNIIQEFFVQKMGMDYGSGLTLFQTLGLITTPLLLLAVFYKPLSDRIGRKPFLIINTFFMGVGMFIIYLSQNIVVYMLGSCVISFFVMHDMHCVYILETAPKEKRATLYSVSKCFAVLGTMFIPLMRDIFMKNDSSKWHLVFLVPAIFGAVISLVALLLARETDAFLIRRIEYLKQTDEEREEIKKIHASEESQGGIVDAVKFSFKHKQLRNLMFCTVFFFIASIVTSTYNTVLKESYGLEETAVTTVLFFYPFGNAFYTLISGFFSDKLGRKLTSVIMSISAIINYIMFIISLTFNFPPWLVGLFIGFFMGSYWSAGDTVGGIMFGESAPTNLRSSVVTVQTLVFGIGGLVGQGIAMVCQVFIPVSSFGIMYTLIAIPSMVVSLILLMKNVGETKGLDLTKITGEEWDDKKEEVLEDAQV